MTKKIDNISIEELEKRAGSMYKVAKILGLSVVAAYKWKKKNKVPAQRIKSLMLLKPEWFEPIEEKVEDKVEIPA